MPRPIPIQFARGSSSADLGGAIARGENAYYRFDAAEGQWAEVGVTSVEDNAVVSVFAPGWRLVPADGGVMVEGPTAPPSAADVGTQWRGLLPEDGSYLVVVGSLRGGATYELRLAVRAPTEDDCGDLAQQPMNRCSAAVAQQLERDRVKAERGLLDSVDRERHAALAAAESAWEAYRDAQCTVEAAFFEGGSMRPTSYHSCVAALTRQRLEVVRRLAAAEGG